MSSGGRTRWILSRNFGGDAAYAEKFQKQRMMVQDEDIRILDIQQAVVDRGGPLPTVVINADAPLMPARRIVQRLAAEEATQPRKVSA